MIVLRIIKTLFPKFYNIVFVMAGLPAHFCISDTFPGARPSGNEFRTYIKKFTAAGTASAFHRIPILKFRLLSCKTDTTICRQRYTESFYFSKKK